jgi:hypothetical protein
MCVPSRRHPSNAGELSYFRPKAMIIQPASGVINRIRPIFIIHYTKIFQLIMTFLQAAAGF